MSNPEDEGGSLEDLIAHRRKHLENLKAADDTWKVRLIEEDFHRLMFDTEGL